jgi:hypothetical protein
MKNIRVLMFGWEFPPHNSGGLGAACFGLTKALTRRNVAVTFVLPKKLKGIEHDFLRIVFANVRNIKMRSVQTIIPPTDTHDDAPLAPAAPTPVYDEGFHGASKEALLAELAGIDLAAEGLAPATGPGMRRDDEPPPPHHSASASLSTITSYT